MDLPASLPDSTPSTAPDGAMATPTSALMEDQGRPDGLTLDAALARMLSSNLDLLALKYEIPQADADVLTAGLRANPLIYGDTQFIPYGKYGSARPLGPTEYDLSITHPLDLSSKRRSRVEVARAARSTVEAQFQDAARRQISNLYRAYIDLQVARLNMLTNSAAVKDQERINERAKKRLNAGEDLSRLDVRLLKAVDSLQDSQDSLDDAREAVALLLNFRPEETSDLDPCGSLRNLAPSLPPLEELTRLTLATRPDLVALRCGVGRAESEVKLAKANRFDDVFLFYDPYTYQDNRSTRQPSGRSWSIGLTVPLPVYNRNQGNIARAHGNVSQTMVELAALERRVVSEVRLAEREYRNSRVALERVEQTTLPAARQSRAKAAASFAAGSLSLNDYLDRLDDDVDTARAYRDALVRHRRAMLDLNTAVGLRLLP